MKKFIELTVGDHLIFHGYDEQNQEIIREIKVEKPMKKLFALDRIQSIGEKYILTTGSSNRMIYWEYEENFDDIRKIFKHLDLLISINNGKGE